MTYWQQHFYLVSIMERRTAEAEAYENAANGPPAPDGGYAGGDAPPKLLTNQSEIAALMNG